MLLNCLSVILRMNSWVEMHLAIYKTPGKHYVNSIMKCYDVAMLIMYAELRGYI